MKLMGKGLVIERHDAGSKKGIWLFLLKKQRQE
jgi:hypothetical protein